MTATVLATFTLITLISIASPGPDTLLALSNGSRFGLRSAVVGIIGVILADLFLILIVATGIGVLMASKAQLFEIIRWAGVIYLAFLGVRLLNSTAPHASELFEAQTQPIEPSSRTFAKGILVAISNPKNYLFFAALLPQFVSTESAQATQYAVLALIVVVVDLTVMLGYAVSGVRLMRMLSQPNAVWLDRGCGIAFLVLAGALALFRAPAAA